MLKFLGTALAVVAVAFTLTACGGSDETISNPADAVVKERTGDRITLGCRNGLMRIDLPLGTTEEAGGTKFELTEAVETKSPSSDPIQKSVKLEATLASTMSLPAIIVRADEGDGTYTGGMAADKTLVLNVQKGGKVNHALMTNGFAYRSDLYGSKIFLVTLCVDQSDAK